MFCSKCGTQFEGNFCPACGTAVAPLKILCPSCGKPVDGNFCPFCGVSVRFTSSQKKCSICGQKSKSLRKLKCLDSQNDMICGTCESRALNIKIKKSTLDEIRAEVKKYDGATTYDMIFHNGKTSDQRIADKTKKEMAKREKMEANLIRQQLIYENKEQLKREKESQKQLKKKWKQVEQERKAVEKRERREQRVSSFYKDHPELEESKKIDEERKRCFEEEVICGVSRKSFGRIVVDKIPTDFGEYELSWQQNNAFVTGVLHSYDGERAQDYIPDLVEDDKVYIEHEPIGDHEFAVRVTTQEGDHLGWLKEDTYLPTIARCLKRGERQLCRVSETHTFEKNDREYWGLEIDIAFYINVKEELQ